MLYEIEIIIRIWSSYYLKYFSKLIIFIDLISYLLQVIVTICKVRT